MTNIQSYEVSIATPLGRTINVVVAAESAERAGQIAQQLLIDFIDTARDSKAPNAQIVSDIEAIHLVGGREGPNLVEDDGQDEIDELIAEGERAVDEAFYGER